MKVRSVILFPVLSARVESHIGIIVYSFPSFPDTFHKVLQVFFVQACHFDDFARLFIHCRDQEVLDVFLVVCESKPVVCFPCFGF